MKNLRLTLSKMDRSQLVDLATDILKQSALVTRWECFEAVYSDAPYSNSSLRGTQLEMLGRIQDGIHDIPDRLNALFNATDEDEYLRLDELRNDLIEGVFYYYAVWKYQDKLKAHVSSLKIFKLIDQSELYKRSGKEWKDVGRILTEEETRNIYDVS